jgi:predicted O-methyltransferase YrrM/AraC-like DNA-binding protein
MTGSGDEQGSFEERLRLQIEAYHEAALVYAAVKLGLPDRMGTRAWTSEQLTAELGLSPPHLLRFLRGLSTLGICEELPDGSFALAPAGQSLQSGAPSRLAEKVRIVVEQYWQPWANLVSCLETGKPAFDHVFGMTVWDWRRQHAEQGDIFNSYLAKETLAQADSILEALDASCVRTIADIGGGGGLIAAVVRANPQVQGILFDRPQTLETAKRFLQSLGVAERVQCMSGDFLSAVEVQADLYLLKSVLQQWDDADSLTILRNCRSAMQDAARLLVIERLIPERALADPAAIMVDLHMMTITGGRVRSREQFEALLSQAGFTLAKVMPTRSGLTIIDAVPG